MHQSVFYLLRQGIVATCTATYDSPLAVLANGEFEVLQEELTVEV